MTKQDFLSYRKPFITAYEGDSEMDDTDSSSQQDKPADKTKNQDTKTFTQDQLNKIIQERVSKEKEVQKELLTKLSELEQGKSLSDEERGKLQKRIEELKNEFLSVEEKAEKEKKHWEEKYTKETSNLTKDRDKWHNEYVNFRIEKELTEAAVANDAITPHQLVKLLRADTKMKDVIDEKGNPTGFFEVRVAISQEKEDGTQYTVELSPAQAMAKLREMPNHWGNQFSAKSVDGSGLLHTLMTKPQDNFDGLKVTGSYEDYKRSRESAKGKAALGLDKPQPFSR